MGFTNIRIRKDEKDKLDVLKREITEIQEFRISDAELLRRTLNIRNLPDLLKRDALVKSKMGYPLTYNKKKKKKHGKDRDY